MTTVLPVNSRMYGSASARTPAFSRISGDPRRAYHLSERPDEHVELFGEAIERLARGEGYDDEP